jgi:hypothetical protein
MDNIASKARLLFLLLLEQLLLVQHLIILFGLGHAAHFGLVEVGVVRVVLVHVPVRGSVHVALIQRDAARELQPRQSREKRLEI